MYRCFFPQVCACSVAIFFPFGLSEGSRTIFPETTLLDQILGFSRDISRIEFSLNVFFEFAEFSDKNNFN